MSYSINDSCVGCTLCAKSCPVRAISGSLRERHSIDPALCVGCGVCGRLCAKGAVVRPDGSAAEFLARKDWKRPVIDRALCSGCSMCVESCPAFCLALTDPERPGDIHTFAALREPEHCLGCGLCEKACPIGAVELR